MTTTNPWAFTTHDGTDENNVRAEVFVQTNKGTVKEIKENTAKEVADVHFSVDGLKFPVHGWIRTDEPIYELVKTAQAANEEVTFRIETQRKPNVDRNTPMAELRVDSNTARDNVKVILSNINGIQSGEAVTSPKQDPRSATGRYVAGDDDVITPTTGGVSTSAFSVEEILEQVKAAASNPQLRASILDNLAAQAIFHGASIEAVNEALVGNDKRDGTAPTGVPRTNFSSEAPSWKKYNSDGRLNLGSSVVTGGVGVENVVHKHLTLLGLANGKNQDEVISYFTDLVFTIADRVQVTSYGEGSRADRAAASHVRIRGLVYDIIDKTFPLPLEIGEDSNIIAVNGKAGIQQWIGNVGKEAVLRFARAIRASQSVKTFGQLVIPASLTGETVTPEAPTQEASSKATKAPVTPATKQKVAEPEAEKEYAPEPPEDTYGPESTTPEESASLDSVPTEVSTEKALSTEGVLMPRILKAENVKDMAPASKETISGLQDLISDSGFDIKDKADLVRISRLLAYTFGEGYSKAQTIPDEELLDFIDWYVGNGSEALHNAVAIATGRS
jgi:hypothetical protein